MENNENLILGDVAPEDSQREENDVLTCDNCKGYKFVPFTVLIWRTRLLNTDLAHDGWAPVQSYRCMDCGNVNSDMDPGNGLLE